MRTHARIQCRMWGDPDYRALTMGAQWLYELLLSSDGLDLAGVHDWRPGRLAARAKDADADTVLAFADELRAALYIVPDDTTEEVLLRSFIRNDGLMSQPNVAAAMVKAYNGTASEEIRWVIIDELKRLYKEEPGLKAWGRKDVLDLLKNPSESASELLAKQSVNPPRNPSADPPVNPPGNGKAKGSGNPPVKVPLTPTPSPAPNSLLPVPPPAGGDATAQTLLGEWISTLRSRPPHSVVGQVSKQVKAMLSEGIDPDHIRAGLEAWQNKKLHPATLPSVVHEVMSEPIEDEGNPHTAWMRS